ncbi:MAG: DMT family protein [Bacteroidetes bacterium]|nr:DMT family protein [Bacteroidota bacterium]
MRTLYTVALLIASNTFMTLAWYGHLKWKNIAFLNKYGIIGAVLFSWFIAFFEYLLMVPANRFGSRETGGNLDLFQLKIIQEVISISVFIIVVIFLFKGETIHWRYIASLSMILGAVWLVFGVK